MMIFQSTLKRNYAKTCFVKIPVVTQINPGELPALNPNQDLLNLSILSINENLTKRRKKKKEKKNLIQNKIPLRLLNL